MVSINNSKKMSSIAELKQELKFVTEHLRIAKENLEYLKSKVKN